MSLTFEIKGALAEHVIRHIIREAEANMADGADAKATLVAAAQDYLTEQHAIDIKAAIDGARELAEMMGGDIDWHSAMPDVKAQIGDEFEKALDAYAGGPVQHLADALAKAAVASRPVLPMNRGKWLSKLGIVADHIKALVPSTTKPAAETPTTPEAVATVGAPQVSALARIFPDIEQPDITDAEMREMLGLAPVPSAPGPFVAAPAAGADAPPQTNADAQSAEPHGHEVPPPPPVFNPRDAFVAMKEAFDFDDAALAQRLGMSRSTVYNYLNGKTAKVKVSLTQARIIISEIDTRVAKLRQAADIFAQVRD